MSESSQVPSLDAVSRWIDARLTDIDPVARRVATRAARREIAAVDPTLRIAEQATFGERVADRVAAFGGSWTFIGLFLLVLLAWVVLNTEVLGATAFDAYPYIFLNLMLSMVAALQAPVIMMSQNRHATKDRQMAVHDYEVNLKAEVEIMALHEKLDALRTVQIVELLAKQERQIELLTRLLAARSDHRDG